MEKQAIYIQLLIQKNMCRCLQHDRFDVDYIFHVEFGKNESDRAQKTIFS